MPYANPPIGWVHTWLRPLYDWLVGLVNIINGGGGGAAWSPVRLLTAGALPANTYVSATQTKTANANGALGNIDGVAAVVGDRVWDNNATGLERGLFVIVSIGGAGKWSMKRAEDADESTDFVAGKSFQVTAGTVGANTGYIFTNSTFVLDTDTPAISEDSAVQLAGDVSGPLNATVIGANKVTYPQLALSIHGAKTTRAGAGAIDITNRETRLTSAATGASMTLADGVTGQRKTLVLDTLTTPGVHTAIVAPAHGGPWTLDTQGDSLELFFDGTNWVLDVDGRASTKLAKLRILSGLGRNNVGAATLVGAKVGDVVVSVQNITDHLINSANFEAAITVADQIQQTSVSDLSAKTVMVFLRALS